LLREDRASKDFLAALDSLRPISAGGVVAARVRGGAYRTRTKICVKKILPSALLAAPTPVTP
jgi:hypothetical protein